MRANTVYLPRYTEGPDAYKAVDRICRPLGRKVALLVGRHGYPAMNARLEAALAAAGSELSLSAPVAADGDLTEARIARLQALPAVRTADMIFGIGGGRVLDTAKAVGERLGCPVLTFPTIASNCAATTSVSIVYDDQGRFDHPEFLSRGPVHSFIDTDVLARAPERYLWAGMGDTYAKYFEAEISARGDRLDHAKSLGLLSARACADTILTDGVDVLADNRAGHGSDALRRVALTILVTTGLVSVLVTLDHAPDYNSDLAHALYYTLTGLEAFDHTQLHGAVVAYGVLILLGLDAEQRPEAAEALERVRAFNRATGLPCGLSDIGLTEAAIRPHLGTVCAMSDVRHRPYPVTEAALERVIREQERWRRANAPTVSAPSP